MAGMRRGRRERPHPWAPAPIDAQDPRGVHAEPRRRRRHPPPRTEPRAAELVAGAPRGRLGDQVMACTTRTDRPASQPARCSSHTLDTSTAPAPARRRTGRLYDRRALPLFCRTPSRSMRGATVAPCPAARAAGMPRYQGAWLDASCVTSRPRYPRVQPPARSPPPRLRCPVGGGFPPPPTLARSGRRPTGCSAQKRQARSTGYLDRGRRRSCQGRPRGGGSLEFRPGTRCSSSGRLRRRRCSRAWTRRGRPADKSR